MATRSKEEAKEEREAKLAKAHEEIAAAAARFKDTQTWKDMLDYMAKMPQYSFRNLVWLHTQAHQRGSKESSFASYTAWKKLGRHVQKGEKSYHVLAPVTYKLPFLKDEDRPIDKSELEKYDKKDIIWKPAVTGFTVRPTFGYHQTDGEPIKGKDLPQVTGQRSEELWQRAKQIVADLGYTYEETTRQALGGAYGVTMRPMIEGQGEKTIAVATDAPEAHQFKTLIHEISHARLHMGQADETGSMHRGIKEVEAESCAYLVSKYFGLDTAEYSTGYIAGWADADEKTILATGERVIQNSNWIIDQLNPQTPSEETVETLQRTHTKQQQQEQSQTEEAHETTPTRSKPPLPGIGEVPQIKKLDHPTKHPTPRRTPHQTASMAMRR
ncbi:ArdC family protein [Pauljensenia sp. UMB1235]|uniref:ArdC family protein n=1 Tax=unclassified Pauljensenia TaxID=2908895 RepID=UPI00254EED84|nr:MULTISPECIES: ArdC family protein [unclassified Pauljensenia]MDK6400913.1 ArdC family protein [Pauljensenia sp. UMB9872]MDK7173459.1 ArdC family protein [Pauljensenia sp. UMB1235]